VSTLTKVLIILLTVSSIFLCGIVVTYVAKADNYKQLWLKRNAEVQSARKQADAARADYDKLKEDKQREINELNKQIGDLNSEIITLKGELAQALDRRDQLLNDVAKYASSVEALEKTKETNLALIANAQTELKNVTAERDKLITQNKELTEALLEKMTIVSQLETTIKQLQDEKSQMQAKFEQYLRQYGKAIKATTPPSLPKPPGKVEITETVPKPVAKVEDIGLRGQVTQVDMKNMLAEISIGAAEGVKEKMKFYVTRGDKFVCEILIFDVDAETAVGFIERVQQLPKAGDNVSTNIGP